MGVCYFAFNFLRNHTWYVVPISHENLICISPAVGIYSIFIYDFGEREHVFQPVSSSQGLKFCLRYLFLLKVRRWGANIINKLFTLSTAEERLLHDGRASIDIDLTKDNSTTIA